MSPPARPPVLVHPARPAEAPRAPEGWRRQAGFDLPAEPWDLSERHLVAAAPVHSEATAAAALQALTRGVGLIISIEVDGDLRHRVLEDLHRLGEVRNTGGHEPDQIEVDDDERRLLEALSNGATVAQAASALHVSLRTANRRLANIRRRLGVTTTAEVVTRCAAQRPSPD